MTITIDGHDVAVFDEMDFTLINGMAKILTQVQPQEKYLKDTMCRIALNEATRHLVFLKDRIAELICQETEKILGDAVAKRGG